MTDAPERIKAWVTRNGVTEWEAGSLQFPPDTEVEYIRADLSRPKVKPLVWEDRKTTGIMLQYRIHIGYGLCNGVVALTLSGSTIGEFPSEEAAKSAAQADYERRILSALEADHE